MMSSSSLEVISATPDRQYAPLDFTPLDQGTRFKVLFVHPNTVPPSQSVKYISYPHLGLGILSACVKKIGAETTLCDLTTVPLELRTEVFRAKLKSYAPDLVAITACTMYWPYVEPIVEECKRSGVIRIVGGPHATLNPEEVMEAADALVVGEGEGALMDVVRALASGQPLAGIPNTWVRTENGRVVRTELRRLIEDLDELPFPDWLMFHHILYRPLLVSRDRTLSKKAKNLIRATIEGSRGCPYQCAYCCNSARMKTYRGKGTWRREKSPRRIIEELKAFRELLGGLDRVFWVDEVFMTSTERVKEISEAYKREIHVPFLFTERPELITEQKVRMLADAGLVGLSIGFESGDERMREAVLNRRTKNTILEQAFLLPKKYGIRVHAFSMVGLPGQDEASMMLTWKWLRRVKPDTAQCTIFRPIRNTALYDECVTKGLYDPQNDTKFWSAVPVIKHDILDDATIIRFQRMLSAFVAKRGIWPVIAFHLGRRYDWAYRPLMRIHRRWCTNENTGLAKIRNLMDVITKEVRSWFQRELKLSGNLVTAVE